ncbi:7TM diverse intracellular signaling domain-containing protein [Oligoflexus tunisiensis]|uniref:7TM diverse intracellular signaling domain-containing protein n=1 Tax=Oligoflexus tunisiensis TaxID=708132 RepID=UPI000A7BA129|nr:7TM diverse intracellular signaling domain-containing protein [Oligoflexus tunisiensis]
MQVLWTILILIGLHPALGFASLLEEPGVELQSLHDPGHDLTPDKIVAEMGSLPWKVHKNLAPNFGYYNGSIWLKLRLPPELMTRGPLFLEMRHTLMDEFHVYQFVDQQWQEQTAGIRIPRADWPMNTHFPSFILKPSPQGFYLMRMQSQAALQVPLALRDAAGFEKQRLWDVALQSLYYGAFVAIALYNFLVWTFTGLRIYGYYVGFLACFAMFQLAYSGVGYVILWPEFLEATGPIMIAGVLIGELCSSLFATRLLDIQGRVPRWFMGYLAAVSVPIFLLALLDFRRYSYWGVMIFAIAPWILFLIWTGVVGIQRRERVAYWYVMAWLFFIVGSMISLLRSGSLIPNNVFTQGAQQVGSAIEFILFSMALADRIKTLQEKVQAESMRALESERMAREADQRALAASQVALKEQKHLVALKDQFLANTSHELRTPLNSMIGLSENMLAHREMDPRNREDVQHIWTASKRLYQLVSNILDFSALQKDMLTVELSDINLKPIIRRVLQQLADDLAFKKLGCDISGIQAGPLGIQGDPSHVATVIHGIVSNAIKFTTQGEIAIICQERDQMIQLAIRDTGIGIPPERLKNLEAHFVQADGGAGRGQGGTGLGLALAYGLVRKLQGKMEIHSQVGVGTTVVLQFLKAQHEVLDDVTEQQEPARLLAAAGDGLVRTPATVDKNRGSSAGRRALALAPQQENAAETPAHPRLYRVLVVDDDAMNRAVLRNFLEGQPYLITEAATGPEALEIFYAENHFDAVLLDVMMPGMTGYEVCRHLRRTHDISLLPVIMLTAKQQAQDIVAGFESGANDYLLKPIHRDELFARMNTHLKVSKRSLAMKRFVPEDIIALLGYQDLADVKLGDAVERRLAITFADIRGFTSAMETMPPADTFNWLNRCYSILGPEIRRAQGFVDKYIGDAILALFPQGAEGAVEAAIAMQRGLAVNNDYWLGMGIHIGPTMIGTLGEPERFEATVLSDAVNVAARIESISKALEVRVIVSEELRGSLINPNQWNWRYLGPFQLRGRSIPVTLYELLDAEPQMAQRRITQIDFETAVQQLIENRVVEALLLLESILKVDPTDPVARYFYERAQASVDKPQDLSLGFHVADPSK